MIESGARKLSGSQSKALSKNEYDRQKIKQPPIGRVSLLSRILSRHAVVALKISRSAALIEAKLKKGDVSSVEGLSNSRARTAIGAFGASSKAMPRKRSTAMDAMAATAGRIAFKSRRSALEAAESIGGIKPGRAGLAMILGALVLIILASTFYGVGLEVTLDGASIGYVDNQEEFLGAVSNVQDRASDILGYPVALVPDVSYNLDYVDRRLFLDTNQVENQLFGKIGEIEELVVLEVDGEVVGAGRSEAGMRDLLSKIKGGYAGGDPTFVQDVSLKRQLTAASNLKAPEEIEKELGGNKQEAITYTARPGDTPELVAGSYGITVEQLNKLNPGMASGGIPAGTELVVRAEVPRLQVKTTSRSVFVEEMAYDTKYVDDSNLYTGKSQVKVKGVVGEMQYTDDVEYINGAEVGRQKVSQVVLVGPVTEVIARGTKTPPPKSPTGKFIRPYRGILTSNYGPRGRGVHTGVDFAGPVGSKIVAADGGVVTFAGWKGTYGNFIIIDHGDGISTAYAHNSKLLVSVGQKVGKGEVISLLGSTGNSTGPHCHFEVRVGGKPVNPWGYIK